MRLSYSAINTYQTCPLMFKFQYLDRLPTKPSEKMWFGNHLHETLKFILEDVYHLPTQAETIKLYSENFDKSIFAENEVAQNYFANGLKIVENFYSRIKKAMPAVVSIEEKFVLPMGEHNISGVFDRVDKITDNHFEIIDYKTGRVPTQDKVDDNLQLTMYDWAAKQKWPHLTDVKLSLHFLAPDLKLSTKRQKEDHQQLEETVNKTAEQISLEKFAPKPGPLCGWCDFQQFCPIMKDRFRQQKRSIDEIVLKYLELKSKESELQDKAENLTPHLHRYMDEKKVEKLFSDLGDVYRTKTGKISHQIKKKK
ncbi:MAG TPA: PD-(D/E)XK nuclease family protein [Patescibacteria group bacterium]|nr:PD-(D/E)XK nuclease family protein [Patescibacteria group bacterium]